MGVPIYVIGSSNTDLVVKADRLPMRGETVIGGAFLMNAGGKGANQAVAAARLGGQVTFVAKVGNDIFGKQALQQFNREHIHTEFVMTDAQYPSGVALIGVDARGENSVLVAQGANSQLDIRVVEQALESIKGAAIILLQLEIPIRIVEFVIKRSFQEGLRVILNPAPVEKLSSELYPQLHLITPNEFEAELLTGIRVIDTDTAEQAAVKLHQLGARNVVITLGSKGAYLHTSEQAKMITAPPVTPIDTTAAGDCFNGAIAVALSEGQALDSAVSFACKASSICVTRMGAQPSLPSRREVDEIKLVSIP